MTPGPDRRHGHGCARGRGQQIGGRNGRGFGQLRASAASPGRDQSRKSARQGRGRAAA